MVETIELLEEILRERGWKDCSYSDSAGELAHLWWKPGHFLLTRLGANAQVTRLSAIEAIASQLAEERLEGDWRFDGAGWTNGETTLETLADVGVHEFATSRRVAAGH